jgi:hypothetical protein
LFSSPGKGWNNIFEQSTKASPTSFPIQHSIFNTCRINKDVTSQLRQFSDGTGKGLVGRVAISSKRKTICPLHRVEIASGLPSLVFNRYRLISPRTKTAGA